MPFNSIHEFQMSIYKLLSNDEYIRLNVDRVYLSVVQDAKYPFVLINILKVNNLSKYGQDIYNIEFEISVFGRDKSHQVLTILADRIIDKLTSNACILTNYIVAGMKAVNINFQRSSDLLTSKIIIAYNVLLKARL